MDSLIKKVQSNEVLSRNFDGQIKSLRYEIETKQNKQVMYMNAKADALLSTKYWKFLNLPKILNTHFLSKTLRKDVASLQENLKALTLKLEAQQEISPLAKSQKIITPDVDIIDESIFSNISKEVNSFFF